MDVFWLKTSNGFIMKINLIKEMEIQDDFEIEVLTGLSQNRKKINSKYFYDDIGSHLFQQITKHRDYYPTNSEREILITHSDDIIKNIAEKEIDLIEFGVGDGNKTIPIINSILNQNKKLNYMPIDISEKVFEQMGEFFIYNDKAKFETSGIVADYIDGLKIAKRISNSKKLVLFLGSNIGNFDSTSCQIFLKKIWNQLNHGDYFLIGFDLKKDLAVLMKAYNDSDKLTEKFNLNILNRINNSMQANFNIESFQHFGCYNPILGAMESFLISLKDQEVFIKKISQKFSFTRFEPIHLEYSFKYLESDIYNLANKTGYTVDSIYYDSKKYFANALWRVMKNV